MVRTARCDSEQEVSQVDEGSSQGRKVLEEYWQVRVADQILEVEDIELYTGWKVEDMLLEYIEDFVDTCDKSMYTIDYKSVYRIEFMANNVILDVKIPDEFTMAQFKLLYGNRFPCKKVIKYEEQHEGIVDGEVSPQQGNGLCVPGRPTTQAGNWLAQQWRNATSVVFGRSGNR